MAKDAPRRLVVARLLAVEHPDPYVRTRTVNALAVLYAVIVLGAASTILLAMTVDSVAALVCLVTTLFATASLWLLRRGHPRAGLALFFAILLTGNLVSAVTEHDARLTAVYVMIPVAVAGVTLSIGATLAVGVTFLLVGVIETLGAPPKEPIGAAEIITAGVICTTAVLLTSLLGNWGERREARRADAAARRAEALADGLREANAGLERRVAERTHELERALGRQEALVAELAELSVRDSLTGLHNRRHADDELPRLVAHAERYGHPLSVALLDLDHFKLVNDAHSHQAGDEVLRAFARLLTFNARAADLVARYGGEEFLVAMPETSLDQALALCERLRSATEAHDWDAIVPGLTVTVSIGVADDGIQPGLLTLIASVDAALHQAKRDGRNQTVAASGAARAALHPTPR